MILIKIILLQVFWFLIIFYGKTLEPILQLSLALGLVTLDFIIYRPKLSLMRYFLLIVFFVSFGFFNDSLLIGLNLIKADSYQYGNLALWIVFIAYYDQIFVKFKQAPVWLTSLVGALGGTLSYFSAAKLGAIAIVQNQQESFIFSQLIIWAIFFPVSLKLYFTHELWDMFLDKTIFFSFDQSGFLRHERKFHEDLSLVDAKGKKALVTGGTSGIGAEVVSSLSKIGVEVHFTGRNEIKGREFQEKSLNSKFISLDMVNWQAIYDFSKCCDEFDYLVFNAGSMPESLVTNNEGIEFQCASQLLGHYYLLVWLKENKKIKSGTRVVWVSSGGMYLKELDLESLFKNLKYDKVDTYANVKRAQVTLVEELAKLAKWKGISIYSMHPGWVATKGLEDALPGFYKFMNKRLRTASQGADTIVWCLVTKLAPRSGGFYFDRKEVSPYLSKKYIPTTAQRNLLMNSLNDFKHL